MDIAFHQKHGCFLSSVGLPYHHIVKICETAIIQEHNFKFMHKRIKIAICIICLFAANNNHMNAIACFFITILWFQLGSKGEIEAGYYPGWG